MIKAVLFDLDGTIIDTEYQSYKVKQELFLKLFPEIDIHQILKTSGMNFKQSIKYLMPNISFQEEKNVFCKLQEIREKQDLQNIVFQEVYEVISSLKKYNLKIAVVSNRPRQRIEQVLNEIDLYHEIDLIVAADMVNKSKPNPQIYEKAMSLLDLTSEECLVVEDSQIGIDAGKASECQVVCRKENRYNLSQIGADYYIDNLLELLDIVNIG
ncbi:HAD family hydrolase [Breznakia pachnodae]|uniref:HAD superfamily hydrolase (TIGR01509 family) n=1 Tax=Breznakia pachnodae TaxID=265178 RepID=A0ABU0E1W4_9FIRM|nr:HAD family phosphatase [Breznakia pachnodae]MDQ0360530.1 HAD superfamily hydrolase (TIGR01509 family) [Breznakia pachnodae]